MIRKTGAIVALALLAVMSFMGKVEAAAPVNDQDHIARVNLNFNIGGWGGCCYPYPCCPYYPYPPVYGYPYYPYPPYYGCGCGFYFW